MTIERSGIDAVRPPGGFENSERLARGVRPRVLAECPRRRRQQALAEGLVDEEALEGVRHRPAIARSHIKRGVAAALAGDRRVEEQRRHAGSERLERREPEALVFRE